MTREEALKKFAAAKRQKQQMVERMVRVLTEECIQRTGKAPESIEVW